MWRSSLGVFAILALAASGCASAPPKQTLFDRLGGLPVIRVVVDDFVSRLRDDSRVSHFFEGSNVPLVKDRLTQFICEVSGGPCKYLGADMKTSHVGLGITNADFDAVAQDLVASLDKFNVPAGAKEELLSKLANMRVEIVEK